MEPNYEEDNKFTKKESTAHCGEGRARELEFCLGRDSDANRIFLFEAFALKKEHYMTNSRS